MAAYLIVDVLEVKDAAAFDEYRQRVAATIEKYRGSYVVRGGKSEILDGEWQPKRLVVIEFPSIEEAKRWYDSEDYRPLKVLRHTVARMNLVLVEGV